MQKGNNSLIEKLILNVANGDMTSFGMLYQAIKSDVFAYALSKTANKQDAEDITHDTFVQIYKNATKYTPSGKPLAWIFTIEINLIRRQYNIRKRTVPLNEARDEKLSNSDLSSEIINNQFLCEIMKCLTEEEREIISLHVVSGLKHREIAKLLDKPLSTVLSKYNRAIKKLKSMPH